jgi:hypothetical protein
MSNVKPLLTKAFWIPFGISAISISLFFAWELNAFAPHFPGFPRPLLTQSELGFTLLLILLLSLNIGLLAWNKRHGTCSVGSKRATTLAGAIGALALLCPACLLIPISILGISLSLAILGPFLPLLRVIAIILLVASAWILRPK